MGYIPDEVAEEVLQKSDIVQVVSEYVLLKRSGKNYFGLCPFHQEDTPSFSVAPDKQIFYCFGCHAGGNVFKFLMLKEGLSYPEAVRRLAQKVGVYIPQIQGSYNIQEQKKKQRPYKIMAAAAEFFHQNLLGPEGLAARNYLQNRDVTGEIIKTFQIGYAPAGWDNLIKYLTSKGCKEKELERLGLIIKNRQGTSYYDRFRNRVILPIKDAAGRIVGFGGRTLDGSTPKYLNTPETSLFNKRHLLYGLHLSRAAIRDSGYAVVMEGYMDVVAAHRLGIKNVVASLGTALTREQVKLLMRYTDEIVIAYDADAAGVKAAIRGLDLIQQMGCRVKILQIPDGKDPDEYFRLNGVKEWNKLIKSAYNLIDYKLHVAVAERIPTTAAEKIRVLQQVLPNLAHIKDPVDKEESIKRVASVLNVSWETVTSEFKRYIAKQEKNVVKQGKIWVNTGKFVNNTHNTNLNTHLTDARQQAEYLLLGLILTDFNLFSIVKEQITIDHFQNKELKKIFSLLMQSNLPVNEPARLMQRLDDKGQQVLGRLLSEKIPAGNKLSALEDCIKIIKKQAGKRRQEELLHQLKEAEQLGDQKRVIELLQELQQLHHTINTDLP
ncbi:DNA primase [Desulfohalotomaculum tongense]|uniref:DNA primase n=1 Tax=Desulforadius tongensis TaxID=1216062 RepID=UPI0019581E88|nr:DNA primase [Desulforadius tongensis]